MTDAAKRRIDAEQSAESSESSDWEGLSSISQSSRPLGTSAGVKKYVYKNKEIRLPSDVSFDEWGKSLCTLKKVKHLEMTYIELVEKSGIEPEIAEYLQWVKNTHGANSIHFLKGPRTQVMNFAAFLEAVGWKSEEKSSSGTGFSRIVKK